MAYINAEKTRLIKKNLSRAFPKFKFSVRNRHHTSVDVTIVSGPVKFCLTEEAKRRSFNAPDGDPDHLSLNPYHADNYTHSEILHGMLSIINEGNYDNSDPMTDYFDVGFYVSFSMGSWDKPYVLTA